MTHFGTPYRDILAQALFGCNSCQGNLWDNTFDFRGKTRERELLVLSKTSITTTVKIIIVYIESSVNFDLIF
jgi:hypothetical protein